MVKAGILIGFSALLLMGCSKNEQLPVASDDNNQLKKGTVSEIKFYSYYTDNGIYVEEGLPSTRKLLKQGTFSGTIAGYGIINTKLSTYEITDCVEVPTDNTAYLEPTMYKITAKGTIALSLRDNCSITVNGNIYPRVFPDIHFDGGEFEGTGIISSGVGKLVGLNNKIFRVYGRLFTSGINDFTNGKINLIITDKLN